MTRPTRPSTPTLVIAAVMAALVIVACTSSGQPPVPRPKPLSAGSATATSAELPALGRSFTSSVNRFSLSVPQGWVVLAATRGWTAERVRRATGVSDVLRSRGGSTVSVASQRMTAGTTGDAWIDKVLSGLGRSGEPACPVQRQGWQPIVVDRHHGGLVGGDFGCQFTVAVVTAGHRGYIFEARPDPDHYTDEIFPQRLLERLLASVRLPGGVST